MKNPKLHIHSVRVEMGTMQRYPHLIEAVHYVSTTMPTLINSAGSDVTELVDAVAKLLPERPGTFEVQVVNEDNEIVFAQTGEGYLPDACFIFIKENNLRIH